MAGTLARLFKNKLAVALLGAALIAGAGTTAALAATGGLAQAANSHTSDSNDDHGHDGSAQQTPNAASGQVEGTISSIDSSGSSFVVKTQGGTNVTVTANAKTIFDDDLRSFGDLKVGMAVEVKGNAQSNTSILATKIERADGVNDANDANDDNDATDDHGGATNSGPSSTSGGSSGTSGSSGGSGRGGHDDGPAHH